MSLIANLQKFVPLGKKPTLPRSDTLALRPVRNRLIEWEPRGDEAAALHLRVPRRKDAVSNFLARWLAYPTHKTIELDEFGAAVWEQCNGDCTVEGLVAQTSSNFKMNRRQAEVSVLAFLKILAQRRLIGFAAPQSGAQAVTKGKQTHGSARSQRQRRNRSAVRQRRQ